MFIQGTREHSLGHTEPLPQSRSEVHVVSLQPGRLVSCAAALNPQKTTIASGSARSFPLALAMGSGLTWGTISRQEVVVHSLS